MRDIKLGGLTLESHEGRNIDLAPALLTRWENGEGYIPSEADMRLLGIRNFEKVPRIARSYWDTSTLNATKGDVIKVILPYDNSGSHKLTDSARLCLSLINPGEETTNSDIDLDKEDRWEQLEGSGVYTIRVGGLALNRALTKEEAKKHELLLIRLGHPDHVDENFARPREEVEDIIDRTFEIGGSEYGYTNMMGQHLKRFQNEGILRAGLIEKLAYMAGSSESAPNSQLGNFAFVRTNDASRDVEINQERNQLGKTERRLTSDQIYSAIKKYIASANEKKVRETLDRLIGQ